MRIISGVSSVNTALFTRQARFFFAGFFGFTFEPEYSLTRQEARPV